MRFLYSVGLVCALAPEAQAQKVSYAIPKDYRANYAASYALNLAANAPPS